MIHSVIHSFRYGISYTCSLVDDVACSELARQSEVVKNHPAWTLGHLAVCLEVVGGQIGVKPALDQQWYQDFYTGSSPTSQRSSYPTKTVLLACLRETTETLATRMGQLTRAELDQPLPNPAYHSELPTVEVGLIQMVVGHTAFHTGQLTVWRKATGYPPCSKHFL